MTPLPSSEEVVAEAIRLLQDQSIPENEVAAFTRGRDMQHRATLASLLPEGEVMDAAIEAGIKAAGNYICDGAVREGVRAAAPILLAAKEREIETLRAENARLDLSRDLDQKAERENNIAWAERVAALEGALKDLIARVDAVGNWGPLSPVTDTHRTLLDGGTR